VRSKPPFPSRRFRCRGIDAVRTCVWVCLILPSLPVLHFLLCGTGVAFRNYCGPHENSVQLNPNSPWGSRSAHQFSTKSSRAADIREVELRVDVSVFTLLPCSLFEQGSPATSRLLHARAFQCLGNSRSDGKRKTGTRTYPITAVIAMRLVRVENEAISDTSPISPFTTL
jgi:hypothetical protein